MPITSVTPTVGRPRQPRRLASGLAALSALALVAGGTATAFAANVPDTELGTDYSQPNQIGWLTTTTGAGSAAVTTDSFDGRGAVKLALPDTTSQASLFRTFGAGTRPTDIPALLKDASYSYAGINVNFQLGIFYTPKDATYGPTAVGGTKCTQAKDLDVVIPGQCYAVIKYEPGVSSLGAYSTVTLDDKQAMYNGEAQPGWWNTQRVGRFAANDRTTSFNALLGEMQSYEVFIVGASSGSGKAGDAWVLNLSFADSTYGFGEKPQAAPDQGAPAAESEALEELITSENIDVAADTASFVPEEGSSLTAIDPKKPFSGSIEWSDPTDAFVDVYSYSTAVYLGPSPVINGRASLEGIDLSHLAAGGHYVVLKGQTSASLAVVEFTAVVAPVVVPDPDPTPDPTPTTDPTPKPTTTSNPAPAPAAKNGPGTLAATGAPVMPIGAAALLLLAAGLIVLRVRKTLSQR